MVETILWGTVPGLLAMILVGIRRFPWRWCAVFGLGFGLVMWALRVATIRPDLAVNDLLDPGTLVLIGALGGTLTQFAFDRGERAQQRRTAAILGAPPG